MKIPMITNGIIPSSLQRFDPDLIISTIPARALCHRRKEHEFLYHSIWASGTTRANKELSDTIICDGTTDHSWYRNACVFGYTTTEWSAMPMNGEVVAPVTKPLATSCNCHPEIYRIGRYGKWLKSYLVHKAYPDVKKILDDRAHS